ncbi:hypothetical protein RhiirA1_474017 [Rhizophagus irregularis]|uniref:Uncharacterized protein n=1 Tax=Rhizophagus irregularis TaxID=588596 RepID=A0A2N0QZE0_9GLOM|nr:hypothetical protein RhiirA1_474017 [Rhizophagus irregularis]
MEPIKDFGIQRFWIKPIKDIGIQRFWMEPIDDFSSGWNLSMILEFRSILSPECRITALDSYFKGPGSIYGYPDKIFVLQFLTLETKVLWFSDFGDNRFFDYWTLKTTDGFSLGLNFGDDRYENLTGIPIRRSAAFLEGISKASVGVGASAEAGAEAGADASAGEDFLDENFEGLRLLRGPRLLG